MFFDDNKRAITTMMAKRNGKGDMTMNPTPMKPEISTDDGGVPSGLHAAAQDIISAHHEKSPQKLAEALGNFLNIHKSEGDTFEGGDEVDVEKE